MSLEVRSLDAAPGGEPVLHGLDLTVPTGTCTAVLGPSGTGKTTLLRVIAGLERPTAGTVHLAGDDVTSRAPEQRDVAVVFQDARLFPSMTVHENVAFPLRMAGRDADLLEVVTDALRTVGLAGFHGRDVGTLSGGEAQRVALARALVRRPKLLLLDEPFAAVDPSLRDDLRTLVDRIRRDEGLTTVLVSHDRDDAVRLGDRVAILLDGTIVQDGTPREVLDQPATAAVARFVGCEVVGREDGQILWSRPEHVWLGMGSRTATVASTSESSSHTRVELQTDDDRTIVAHVPPSRAPQPGEVVHYELRRVHRLPEEPA